MCSVAKCRSNRGGGRGRRKREGEGPILAVFVAAFVSVSRRGLECFEIRPSVCLPVADADGFVEADTVHSRQFPRSAAVPSGSGRVSGTNAFRSQFSLPSLLLE